MNEANATQELLYVTRPGDDTRYSLGALPDENSAIIKTNKEDILQGLQISAIITNLKNISGLLFVAYNALGGTKVQSKISGLQKEYLDLLDDSGLAITKFKNRSGEIGAFVVKAYSWLTKGKEGMAILQFDKCAKAAAEMAEIAEDLANRFSVLSTRSETVLESTQDEQATRYKEMEELEKKQGEYNASLQSQKALQQQLNEDITAINEVYEDARKREKEAYDLKKGLMITQAVVGCIGALVPFGGSMLGAGGGTAASGDGKAIAEAQKDMDAKTQEKKEKEALLAAKKAEMEELQAEKEPLQAEVKTLESKILVEEKGTSKSDEEKEAALEELKAQLDATAKKLAALKAKEAKLEKSSTDLSQEVGLIDKAVKEIQGQLQSLADSAKDDADRAAESAKRALDSKLELEAQRRQTLASIQEFAILIENSAKQHNVAEPAVQTLQVAISCIKQVVVALQDAALFWHSMESYCQRLSGDGIGSEIKEMAAELTLEERLEYYNDDDFKLAFLLYISRWAALQYVCNEYYEQNKGVRQGVAENIRSAPTREEGWQAAGVLSAEMNKSISLQIEESKAVSHALMA